MAFLALRASHADFLDKLEYDDNLEIAAGVERKSTQFDDHRTATNLAVETSWLIPWFEFFHFRLNWLPPFRKVGKTHQ